MEFITDFFSDIGSWVESISFINFIRKLVDFITGLDKIFLLPFILIALLFVAGIILICYDLL